MRRVMVRYTVKPDRVEENERLVRAVYAELAVATPEGLRYATIKLDDGVTFVHVASHEAGNPVQEIAAFQRFTAEIRDRCDEPPVTSELTEVGSFNLFET
jgi:hypothetical protein